MAVKKTKSSKLLGDYEDDYGERDDFVTLDQPKRQANILIFGDGGTGKTSFVTRYAPPPIAVINFDGRDQHAVYEALQLGREIHRCSIDFTPKHRMSPDQVKSLALESVDKVERNFERAVFSGKYRTILLDTGTEYSEILKLSFDGVQEQTKEGAYGKDKDYVNRRWWKLFNLARQGNAHLVVTARASEIWINNQPTGRFKMRGAAVINDAVDWAGWISHKKGPKGRSKKEIQLEITKAGINLAELGAVYDKSDWDEYGGPFVYACYQQFIATSDLEDWK